MDRVGTLVCPVLVGRDDLLELAERRLEAGRGGHGHLLFLAGEAGIGKTRLLGSIERRAASLGYRVVRGGTYPGDLEVSAAVFLDLARAMARVPALADVGARLSARLEEPATRASDRGDRHRRRRILTLDTAALLAECAAEPTLLALEDLHQADDLSLEIVAGLARRLPELPLVVIGSYRSDELYPRVPMREWRARLITQRQAEEARLGRLSAEETALMTGLLLERDQPVAHDVALDIHRRTDGIPLHVEELIGLLGTSGAAAAAGSATPDVPDTLEAAILARIERRTDDAQALARVGAVIGRSFEFDLLARVLGRDADDLSRPLEELADHFFLAPSPASGRYGFRHALICDAIYGRIPDPERRQLHARIADAAAERGDFGDAFLSSHFERAGLSAAAFDCALRAARAATAISAHREAFDLYERALRNAPTDLPVVERAELVEEHAAAAAAVDDNAVAADGFERARAHWLDAGAPVRAAAVIASLVAVRHLLGDDLEARVTRLGAAIAELDDVRSDPEVDRVRARLLAGTAAAYMLDRRLDDAIEHGRAARELAARVGAEAIELNVATTYGSVLVFAGRGDEGWPILESAVRRARDGQREVEASRAYRMIGSSASVLVEYDLAERWLREGIDYAERVESWNDRHYMAAHLAHVRWATGHWDDATTIAAHALADGRGGVTTRITALHVLGYLALGRGDVDGARAALDEARVLGERMHELQRLSPALWGLAELELAVDRPDAAVAWTERGLAASAAVDDAAYLFPFLVTGTRARLAARDPADAERWVAEVGARLRRRAIPGTLPAIDHAEGLLHLASGATGRARASLKAAVAGWTDRRRAWEGTAARIDLATTDLRANRASDAARLAEEALTRADEIGSPVLAGAARAVQGRARARHPAEEPWAPLTAREFEVARRVADGGTNAAIAAELGISPRTVGAHVEHILAKLGVNRRAEIAAWATTVDGGARSRESGDASSVRSPGAASPPPGPR